MEGWGEESWEGGPPPQTGGGEEGWKEGEGGDKQMYPSLIIWCVRAQGFRLFRVLVFYGLTRR